MGERLISIDGAPPRAFAHTAECATIFRRKRYKSVPFRYTTLFTAPLWGGHPTPKRLKTMTHQPDNSVPALDQDAMDFIRYASSFLEEGFRYGEGFRVSEGSPI